MRQQLSFDFFDGLPLMLRRLTQRFYCCLQLLLFLVVLLSLLLKLSPQSLQFAQALNVCFTFQLSFFDLLLVFSNGATRFVLKLAQPLFLSLGAQPGVLDHFVLLGHATPGFVFHSHPGRVFGLKASILFRTPPTRFFHSLLPLLLSDAKSLFFTLLTVFGLFD